MPDGRFRRYYWQIHTLLSENAHLLDMDHPTYKVCEDYEVEYSGAFRASIYLDKSTHCSFVVHLDGS